MQESHDQLSEEDKKAFTRYFKLLLRVFKRVQEEIKINPSMLDHLEPEFRLLLTQN